MLVFLGDLSGIWIAEEGFALPAPPLPSEVGEPRFPTFSPHWTVKLEKVYQHQGSKTSSFGKNVSSYS